MKKYNITFARYDYATIEAETEEEAYRKVEGYGKEDIEWSDEFEATDVQGEE